MSLRQFLCTALILIGGLMTLLCGGCTLAFVVESLTTPMGPGNYGPMTAIMAVLFGAFGIIPGMALFAVGWILRKDSPRP